MFDPSRSRPVLRHAAAGAALAVAGALFFGSAAVAQEGAPPPDQEVDVSDSELETFTEAYLDVQEIRDELNREIEGAENAREAQALQEEADQEMVRVIEEQHEIGVERYNRVSQAVHADPELYEEFESLREELTDRDEEGGGYPG